MLERCLLEQPSQRDLERWPPPGGVGQPAMIHAPLKSHAGAGRAAQQRERGLIRGDVEAAVRAGAGKSPTRGQSASVLSLEGLSALRESRCAGIEIG